MRPLYVADVMTRDVITLESDHSLNLAEGLMRMAHVRHLPVVDGGRLVGLLTHRDLIRAQAAYLARPYRDPSQLVVPVHQIMKTSVWSVTSGTSVLEAAQIMLDHRYGCLPVVDDDRLVGIVTEVDLLGLLVAILARRRDREDTDPRVG